MNNPLVSVVMPVYNGAKYLKESIESVLSQTYTNFELIIINDGSTDKSEKIIKSFDDDRIVYIKNEKNLKIVKSLNKGLNISKGKFIARIDSDDIMNEDRLKVQVEFLLNHLDIDIVGSMWYSIDDDSKIFGAVDHLPVSYQECAFMMIVEGENPVGHPCVLFRKDILLDVLEYSEVYDSVEDVEFWFRAFLSNKKFHNIDLKLTSYRYHSNQISQVSKVQQINHDKVLLNFLEIILEEKLDYKIVELFRAYNFNKTDIDNIDLKNLINLKLKSFDYFFRNYTISPKEKIKFINKFIVSLFSVFYNKSLSKYNILLQINDFINIFFDSQDLNNKKLFKFRIIKELSKYLLKNKLVKLKAN